MDWASAQQIKPYKAHLQLWGNILEMGFGIAGVIWSFQIIESIVIGEPFYHPLRGVVISAAYAILFTYAVMTRNSKLFAFELGKDKPLAERYNAHNKLWFETVPLWLLAFAIGAVILYPLRVYLTASFTYFVGR